LLITLKGALKMKLPKLLFFPTFCLMLVGLTGCGGVKVPKHAHHGDVAKEIQSFESELNAASTSQVDIMSPSDYSKAQKSLEEAKAGANKGYAQREVLHDIAKGRAYLKRAGVTQKVASTQMIEESVSESAAAVVRTPEDKFEKVRSQFSEDEADVYKDGNSITVRLKSLHFPSAQSSLGGSDINLLSKAEKSD